jgi:hypothetical protein
LTTGRVDKRRAFSLHLQHRFNGMDPFGVIAIILSIGFVIALIALPWTFIRYMNARKPPVRAEHIPVSPEIFAKFEYSPDEWPRVYRSEFVEDTKAKRFTDPLTGVIVTDTIQHQLSSPHIFFHPNVIYISDGREGKRFRVNDVNEFGYGIFLHGIELKNADSYPVLSVTGESRSSVAGFGPVNHKLEYTLPVPAKSTGELSAIIDKYLEIRVHKS